MIRHFMIWKTEDHYGAVQTIVAQKNIYLTTGSILRAESGKPLLETQQTRQADTILWAVLVHRKAIQSDMREKRDICTTAVTALCYSLPTLRQTLKSVTIAPNINFFMNVPITKEGGYKFDDGVSAPGKYVEMKALADVMILISNCPQLNNPCKSPYNPTPVRLLIWD